MKTFVAVVFLAAVLNDSTSMIHTLRIFQTLAPGSSSFPEFVAVTVVNDMEVMRFDSRTKRLDPKQPWMDRVTEFRPEFWVSYTETFLYNLWWSKECFEVAKRLLNRTEGDHIWQEMYAYKWNDETEEVSGYRKFAFDGEDLISLDYTKETWVVAKPAVAKLIRSLPEAGDQIFYFHRVYGRWLRIHTHIGKKNLSPTAPVVSLLQTSSSSPVACHATGFYPEEALLYWTKDGEELGEVGDILPNGDGTFQSSVSVDLSSVPAEDWGRYSCEFQLSGDKNDLITKLDRDKIRTNEGWSAGGEGEDTTWFSAKTLHITIISAAVVLAAVIVITAAVALLITRRRRAQEPTTATAETRIELDFRMESPVDNRPDLTGTLPDACDREQPHSEKDGAGAAEAEEPQKMM